MHNFNYVHHHFPCAASRARQRAGKEITEKTIGDPYRAQQQGATPAPWRPGVTIELNLVKHHFPGAASRAQHRAGNDITERRNGDPYRVQPTHTSATPPCPSGYGNYVCSGTQTQTHAGQSRFRVKWVLPARCTPDITST